MTDPRAYAQRRIDWLRYRQTVTPYVIEPTEAYALANEVAMEATGVMRRAVDNRWCADQQRAAFLAYHEAVLEDCRIVARLALSSAPVAAINRLAGLFTDAQRAHLDSLTVSVI